MWKVTYRPWLTTVAPIFISFSRKLVSDHACAVFRIARARMKRKFGILADGGPDRDRRMA
jgi:hypothetical protein